MWNLWTEILNSCVPFTLNYCLNDSHVQRSSVIYQSKYVYSIIILFLIFSCFNYLSSCNFHLVFNRIVQIWKENEWFQSEGSYRSFLALRFWFRLWLKRKAININILKFIKFILYFVCRQKRQITKIRRLQLNCLSDLHSCHVMNLFFMRWMTIYNVKNCINLNLLKGNELK